MKTVTAIVPRVVTDAMVDKLTGISTQYYLQTGNVRDLNVIRTRAQQQWESLLAVSQTESIDARWADIDFDKVNADMRDMQAQIERLQAHIERSQPIEANAQGYVETTEPAPNMWKAAVLNQLAMHALDAPIDMTPADILQSVIDMAVTMATDPAISKPRGKQ